MKQKNNIKYLYTISTESGEGFDGPTPKITELLTNTSFPEIKDTIYIFKIDLKTGIHYKIYIFDKEKKVWEKIK